MKKAFSALLGSALFVCSSAALAQQAGWSGSYAPSAPMRPSGLDNIGEEYQFVFGVDRVMGVAFDRQTLSPGGGVGDITNKQTTIALFGMGGVQGTAMTPRLALDFFPMESLSIGGSLVYINTTGETETDAGSTDNPTVTTFAFAPRVGYAIPFDETFSFWPRAGITYFSQKVEDSQTASGVDLTIEGMFGISPFSHFAILIGPYLDLGLSGTVSPDTAGAQDVDSKFTSFGLATSIVGYY